MQLRIGRQFNLPLGCLHGIQYYGVAVSITVYGDVREALKGNSVTYTAGKCTPREYTKPHIGARGTCVMKPLENELSCNFSERGTNKNC